MSGTTSLSLQQQFDRFGQLLIGGLVYTFQAGTLTPQSAFRDASLSTAWPNPLNLDASARVPSLWFADGVVRIRVTDVSGVVQFDGDALPVLGSSSTSTPTAPTDPNALYSFGDLKVRYGTGPLTGYVRCNGNSISRGGFGGTERANDDTLALYTYLYGLNDIDLVVPGRTGNATDDFNSGLTLALPDFRGVLLGFLDDMGASASGRLNLTNWTTAKLSSGAGGTKNPTTLGALGGSDNYTIAQTNLPNVNLGVGNITLKVGTATAAGLDGTGTGQSPNAPPANTYPSGSPGQIVVGGNVPLGGGDTAKVFLPPMRLITVYIRL